MNFTSYLPHLGLKKKKTKKQKDTASQFHVYFSVQQKSLKALRVNMLHHHRKKKKNSPTKHLKLKGQDF